MAFTDDIGATPGVGATFRALVDGSTGILWPPELAAYAVSVAAGNNVLQVVTQDLPLPVTDQRGDDRLQILLRQLMQGEELQLLLAMLLESINNRAGAAGYDPFQVTVNTSPTVVVAQRPTRRLITLVNTGTVSISLIDLSTLAASGCPLAVGASITLAVTSAIIMVVTSGSTTGTVSGWEEFD